MNDSSVDSTGQDGDRERRRVEERAHLLPEEAQVGSALPEEQAQAILAESEERVAEAERDLDIGAGSIEQQRAQRCREP